MPVKSIRQALQEALLSEMNRDPRVVIIGEDVSGGAGTEGGRDAAGGVLGVTKGLIKEFGEARVTEAALLEATELDTIDHEVAELIEAAVAAARAAPPPPAEALLTDVYVSY